MILLCVILTKQQHESSRITSEYLHNSPLHGLGTAAPIVVTVILCLVADVLLSAAFRLRSKHVSNGAKG
jgi:hypothetical protein